MALSRSTKKPPHRPRSSWTTQWPRLSRPTRKVFGPGSVEGGSDCLMAVSCSLRGLKSVVGEARSRTVLAFGQRPMTLLESTDFVGGLTNASFRIEGSEAPKREPGAGIEPHDGRREDAERGARNRLGGDDTHDRSPS